MGAGCTLAGRGAACCCCWLGAEQIAFFQTLFKSAQRIQARRVVVAVLLLVALLVAGWVGWGRTVLRGLGERVLTVGDQLGGGNGRRLCYR